MRVWCGRPVSIGVGGAGDVTERGLDVGDIFGHQQPFDVVHPLAVVGERQMPLQPQQFFAFGLTVLVGHRQPRLQPAAGVFG